MTQHIQEVAQRADRAATLAVTVALARRRVLLQRRQGQQVGPLAWFAVEGLIDQQVVRAVWADGQLSCDRLLGARARLLVDLGAEFSSDDPPRRYRASLQAPPVAVLLTLSGLVT
jgi:hypothetical protein